MTGWLTLVSAVLSTGAAFAHPGPGIVVDQTGRVYFVVLGDSRIFTIAPDGSRAVWLEDDRVRLPHHLVIDADGGLYTVSDDDGRVWRIAPDGGLTPFFPSGRVRAARGIQVGQYGNPFTIDSSSAIYAVSGDRNRIVRIEPSGAVTPVGDAPFGDLHFSAMAWGPDGALYVTDHGRVWRIPPHGSAAPLAISGDTVALGVGIAVARSGALYVADYSANRVLRIGPDGRAAAAPGTERVRWAGPVGVALGPGGALYVLDHGPGVTRVFRVTGERVQRLYTRRDPFSLIGPGILTAFLLLLVAQTWVRRPASRIDWGWWTTAIGCLIAVTYAVGGSIPGFSLARHAVLLLYVLAAARSYRRVRAPGLAG